MKKIVAIISRVFLALLALMLLTAWSTWFISTPIMLNQYQVTTETVTGINALKTSMGGAALIISIFIFLYFIKGEQWLLPVIISTGVLLVTRTISMIVDGASQVIWTGIILEILLIVAATILLLQRQKYLKQKSNE